MRAAVVDRYGPPEVVRVVELPDPEPKADEVLVRVASVAVTSGDARIRGANFPKGFGPFTRVAFGFRGPRRPVLGSAAAGRVVAVGDRVDGVAVGDEVCGMNGLQMGGHAELMTFKADRVARRPPAVTEDAAAGLLFGGSTARHFLGKVALGPGTTVLVNGAAGAIGTTAVQLAARLGAEVTGVCREANAELVTGLGAARTIDHTVHAVASLPDRYDVVLECVGNLGLKGGRGLLAEGGTLLLAIAGLSEALRARGNVIGGTAPERADDYEALLALVAAGELRVVLDRVLPLDGIVEAHRVVDSGRKVGNVVVRP